MSWDTINQFFVKEHVGMFKAANNYDVLTLEGKKVLECREPNLGLFTKMLRFSDYKCYTPFQIEIRDSEQNLIVTVKRGISLFLSKVEVFDGTGKLIGGFKQKMFSFGGKFDVLDAQDKKVCELKGKWTGWDFRFLAGDHEMAHVTKKWAGMGKELFTSADNYVLEIDVNMTDPDIRRLIFASVMCIDMVLKE